MDNYSQNGLVRAKNTKMDNLVANTQRSHIKCIDR